jgi:GTP-binding protein HflX
VVEDGLIEAMNKIDLLDPAMRASLENRELRNSQRVALSASGGEGCDELLALIDRRVESDIRAVRLDIPLSDGKTLAWIYRHGEVLGRRDDNEAAHLSVRLSEADIARLRHHQRLH